MEIILNGKATLGERFADIDIVQVRKLFAEEHKVMQKYPKRMAEVFKITHLPRRLDTMLEKKSPLCVYREPINSVLLKFYHRQGS